MRLYKGNIIVPEKRNRHTFGEQKLIQMQSIILRDIFRMMRGRQCFERYVRSQEQIHAEYRNKQAGV